MLDWLWSPDILCRYLPLAKFLVSFQSVVASDAGLAPDAGLALVPGHSVPLPPSGQIPAVVASDAGLAPDAGLALVPGHSVPLPPSGQIPAVVASDAALGSDAAVFVMTLQSGDLSPARSVHVISGSSMDEGLQLDSWQHAEDSHGAASGGDDMSLGSGPDGMVECPGPNLNLHVSSETNTTVHNQSPTSDQANSGTSFHSRNYTRADYNTDRWHSRHFLQAQEDYRVLMEEHMRRFHQDFETFNRTATDLAGNVQRLANAGVGQEASHQRLAEDVDRKKLNSEPDGSGCRKPKCSLGTVG
ncbi:uncharacterized protein [Hyperolius riggenbachi]|uniref:uncharacterized protein n=1 Tax=Hyperolius riggenbachi TaxID=752182 RepID=UPI0035A387AE